MLQDCISNNTFTFNCGRWLSKDLEDGKIEVDLNLDFEENKPKSKQKANITESSSSWNSSEDEDSISFGGKGKSLIRPPANNLNQIKEMNEINTSKVSVYRNNEGKF